MTKISNGGLAFPKTTIDGLTFLPIPEFSEGVVAFGANEKDYFNRHKLPEVPRKFTDEVHRLFFKGGEWPEFGEDVDVNKAKRAIMALLSSWAPAHEAKVATVAYALWVWSPEASKQRLAAREVQS